MTPWQKKQFLKVPGNHVVTVVEVYKKDSKAGFPQIQVEMKTDDGQLISTWITAKALNKKTGIVGPNVRALELLSKLKLSAGLGPNAKAEELKGKRIQITAQVDFLGVSDFNPAPTGGEGGNGFDDFNNPSDAPPAHSTEQLPW